MRFSVDTVFVWVTDLDRSTDWYSTFGIEAGPRYGAWQAMILDGAVSFALHQGERPEGPSTGGTAIRMETTSNCWSVDSHHARLEPIR